MLSAHAALAGAAALGTALAAARLHESLRRQRALARLDERARAAPIPEPPDAAALQALPAPVQRWLARALPPAAVAPLRLRYEQSGELRAGVDLARWMPFRATHTVAPATHDFLWDARVAIAPGLHLRVTDSLIDGSGSGRVALQSTLRLASVAGGVAMNAGALHRFLAEAVWYPWALRPSPALRWSPIDESSALATLDTGALAVALEFRFDAAGNIAGIHTPARWGRLGGGFQQRAWEGHFGRWIAHRGLRLPLEGEVGWYPEGSSGLGAEAFGWEPVWRGRIDPASIAFG